jgi:phage/plasmid-like protein (TIGR03299 family)
MFYAGTVPWHRLGTRVEEAVTGAEAIKLAGLDWKVEQRPLLCDLRADGAVPTEIPDRVANVRSDTGTYLGTVGKTYCPVQNRVLFDFADALLQEGARFETAGALKDGRRVWALARLGENIKVGEGDQIERYLCLANGHDGSLAFRVFLTGTRVVCANTLRAAMPNRFGKGHQAISLRHTTNVMQAVKEARKVLGIVTEQYGRVAELWRKLRGVTASEGAVSDYFAHLFPVDDKTERTEKRTKERIADLEWNFRRGRGAERAGQTWWGAYNAVTEHLSHQKRYTGRDNNARLENRMQQLMLDGTAASLDTRALDLALRGAEISPQ